jgi:hypothetical protein
MTLPQQQPVIRPGQRVPYHKGTQAEIDQRRGCVARLLARGVPKMTIHRFVMQKFNRQWRTTDRDIAFVTSTNTWLARARAGYSQIPPSENLETLQSIYGINAK